MYYEDRLDTAVNDETSVEFKLRQKEAKDSIKRLDKNYEKYSIPFNKIWTDGKYYKRITIENYGSGTQNTRIRNAVTGTRYNIMVGSSEQDLLFKVSDSTGRDGRREPLMLFYDSPDQYENHHFTSVSTEAKQQWFQRSRERELERELEAEKRLNM